ncbi:MAG: hypothetical protein Q7O66_23745, partial [Dehalococcoidia bacterium]|nr:hypothetical protein [Dehalococcoidia bacterium]
MNISKSLTVTTSVTAGSLNISGAISGGGLSVTSITSSGTIATTGTGSNLTIAGTGSSSFAGSLAITKGLNGAFIVGTKFDQQGSTASNTFAGSLDVTKGLAFFGEIRPDGLDCANGQILKKTGANDWDCATDATGSVGADSLDFIDFETALNLDDGDTTITGGNFALTFDHASVSANFEVRGYASASKTFGSGLAADCLTGKLTYTVATGLFSCGTDDDIPDAADYSNLTGSTGIGHAATGTLTFDATELNALTWGDGTQASNLWTFDVSGTDPTILIRSSGFDITGGVSISQGFDVAGATSSSFAGSLNISKSLTVTTSVTAGSLNISGAISG